MEKDMNRIWAELVAQYTSMLKLYAMQRLPPHLRHLIEDAVNETFLNFFQFTVRNNLNEIENLGSYLRVITERIVMEYVNMDNKKHSRNLSLDEHDIDLEASEPSPEVRFIVLSQKKEAEAVFKDLMDQLPARQRMAVHLRIFCGLTYEQIAQEMHTSEENVRNHVSIGRRSLIEQYQRWKEEEGVSNGEKNEKHRPSNR